MPTYRANTPAGVFSVDIDKPPKNEKALNALIQKRINDGSAELIEPAPNVGTRETPRPPRAGDPFSVTGEDEISIDQQIKNRLQEISRGQPGFGTERGVSAAREFGNILLETGGAALGAGAGPPAVRGGLAGASRIPGPIGAGARAVSAAVAAGTGVARMITPTAEAVGGLAGLEATEAITGRETTPFERAATAVSPFVARPLAGLIQRFGRSISPGPVAAVLRRQALKKPDDFIPAQSSNSLFRKLETGPQIPIQAERALKELDTQIAFLSRGSGRRVNKAAIDLLEGFRADISQNAGRHTPLEFQAFMNQLGEATGVIEGRVANKVRTAFRRVENALDDDLGTNAARLSNLGEENVAQTLKTARRAKRAESTVNKLRDMVERSSTLSGAGEDLVVFDPRKMIVQLRKDKFLKDSIEKFGGPGAFQKVIDFYSAMRGKSFALRRTISRLSAGSAGSRRGLMAGGAGEAVGQAVGAPSGAGFAAGIGIDTAFDLMARASLSSKSKVLGNLLTRPGVLPSGGSATNALFVFAATNGLLPEERIQEILSEGGFAAEELGRAIGVEEMLERGERFLRR